MSAIGSQGTGQGQGFAAQFFSPVMSTQISNIINPTDGTYPNNGRAGGLEPPDAPVNVNNTVSGGANRPNYSLEDLIEHHGGEAGENVGAPSSGALNNSNGAPPAGAPWLDGQRIGFLVLGIILVGVAVAWLAAPKASDLLTEVIKLKSLGALDRVGRPKKEASIIETKPEPKKDPPNEPMLDDGARDPRPSFKGDGDFIEGELSDNGPAPAIEKAARRAARELDHTPGKPVPFTGEAKRTYEKQMARYAEIDKQNAPKKKEAPAPIEIEGVTDAFGDAATKAKDQAKDPSTPRAKPIKKKRDPSLLSARTLSDGKTVSIRKANFGRMFSGVFDPSPKPPNPRPKLRPL